MWSHSLSVINACLVLSLGNSVTSLEPCRSFCDPEDFGVLNLLSSHQSSLISLLMTTAMTANQLPKGHLRLRPHVGLNLRGHNDQTLRPTLGISIQIGEGLLSPRYTVGIQLDGHGPSLILGHGVGLGLKVSNIEPMMGFNLVLDNQRNIEFVVNFGINIGLLLHLHP